VLLSWAVDFLLHAIIGKYVEGRVTSCD